MDLKFNFDIDTGDFDLSILRWDLETDDGFEAAILISLFTDARVTEEELSAGDTELRGWWGDAVENPDQQNTGSKLWLLDRTQITDEVLEAARQYSLEALQWLLDDGIVGTVDVDVTRLDTSSISIAVQLTRPGKQDLNFKYDYVWEARANGI